MVALQNRYKLLIPKPPSSLTSLVSELIDHDFGCWNSQLFGQLFLPFELAQILYIPLPAHSHLDQFSLGPNMRGVFSVKSAYHFIKDCEERSQPQAFGLLGRTLWCGRNFGTLRLSQDTSTWHGEFSTKPF